MVFISRISFTNFKTNIRNVMNRLSAFIIWMIIACSGRENFPPANHPVIPPVSIRAADVSFLPEIRTYGISYKNFLNQPDDVLNILKSEGCNTIRLRLWHTPSSPHSGLEEVASFAQEIREKGFDLWITLHYSDTWADPGQQTLPQAWQSLSFGILSDSVYAYSRKIASLLQPDYIQAGNEINDGFLWPHGKFSTQRSQFIHLLKQAISGLREGCPDTKVLVHYANPENSSWFFQVLKDEEVHYDMIALSYYPRWHGKSLENIARSMLELHQTFRKPIVIAETAYPFTLGWADQTNNLVGLPDQLISGYSATQEGQYHFMLRIRRMIASIPGGQGFCYWAPEWVAFKGPEATNGSPWENMALFDFNFKAVKAIRVFQAVR